MEDTAAAAEHASQRLTCHVPRSFSYPSNPSADVAGALDEQPSAVPLRAVQRLDRLHNGNLLTSGCRDIADKDVQLRGIRAQRSSACRAYQCGADHNCRQQPLH